MHETLSDALREVITAAGGFKTVGALLFPDAPVDQAAGRLRDRLNDERREFLHPEQLTYLIRLGRRVGCHALLNFMARDAGYAEPTPIEPEDEIARLQREFVAATRALGAMATRIETISARTVRQVA